MASGAQEKLLDEQEGQCYPGAEGDEKSPEADVVIAVADEDPDASYSVAPIAPAAVIPAATAHPTNQAIIPINPFQPMEGAVPVRVVQPHVGYGSEGRSAAVCRSASCRNVALYQCSHCRLHFCGTHCRTVMEAGRGHRSNRRKCVECIRSEVQQRQRVARNRGMAHCCVRRLVIRLLIFFILIILATVYSSSNPPSSSV